MCSTRGKQDLEVKGLDQSHMVKVPQFHSSSSLLQVHWNFHHSISREEKFLVFQGKDTRTRRKDGIHGVL